METLLNWVAQNYGLVGLLLAVVFALLAFYIREQRQFIQSMMSELRDERNYVRRQNEILQTIQKETLRTLNAIERISSRRDD